MLNKDLEVILDNTLKEAKEKRHEYATVEHILYAIIQDDFGSEIIFQCKGDVSVIKKELLDFFDEFIPKVKTQKNDLPILSAGFQRVIRNAISHVQLSGKKEVDAGDLLVAIYNEEDSYSINILKGQGISKLDILNYISHGVSKIRDDFNYINYKQKKDSEIGYPTGGYKNGGKDYLLQFATELVELATKGKLTPVIGRDEEIKTCIHILSRRKKNNVIFVGDPGVGKTAIVEGLALKIAKKDVPESLTNAKIYSLDMGAMLAGTQFRGDFETRLKETIKAIMKEPKAIMFIDEIHTIVGAGASSGGAMDASNILKPYLNSGQIHCIGATTYEEYKKFFDKDRALARRFQKVDVLEPSIEETYKILLGIKKHYEKFHGVKYKDKALRSAVELSSRFINDRHLPDKAIDIMDDAGAQVKLLKRTRPIVTVKDIEDIISKITKIPVKSISSSEKNKLINLESDLKSVIFGQEEAIKAVVQAIKRAKAGLANPTSPIGSFLFTGPTGVGKTELAKQLAKILNINFLRFDMSEYMEKHSVSRLIGAPPGYIGFDQGGLLTDSIRKHPNSVLLLDEIEKAHPDIFNVLLQIMDYATLTDNNGKKADFRNVIIIMTSNVGAKEIEENPIGFGNRVAEKKEVGMIGIQKLFSPEFRNRLTGIVIFNNLKEDIILNIVDKYINEINLQLKDKKIEIRLTNDAKKYLAEKGYDKAFGARPLKRLIEMEIVNKLTDAILSGQIKRGGKVIIELIDHKLHLNYDNRKYDH